MLKSNIALALSGLFIPQMQTPQAGSNGRYSHPARPDKGQKRSARQKPSGVAAMKRAATKRNNIRKRK